MDEIYAKHLSVYWKSVNCWKAAEKCDSFTATVLEWLGVRRSSPRRHQPFLSSRIGTEMTLQAATSTHLNLMSEKTKKDLVKWDSDLLFNIPVYANREILTDNPQRPKHRKPTRSTGVISLLPRVLGCFMPPSVCGGWKKKKTQQHTVNTAIHHVRSTDKMTL